MMTAYAVSSTESAGVAAKATPSAPLRELYLKTKKPSLGSLEKFKALVDDDAAVHFVPSGIMAAGVQNVYETLRSALHVDDVVESDTTVRLTVGDDTVVEESVLTLVHTDRIEWLLPQSRLTQKRLVVPLITSATFRNGKLLSKRVYWDQASILKQLGVLPNSLYSKAAGCEMVLPVVGVRIADALLRDAVEAGVTPAPHLAETAQALEAQPAGVTSRQANDPNLRAASSATPRKQTIDSVGAILTPPSNANSQGRGAGDSGEFRPSTRVFAKDRSNPFEAAGEPVPLHTSIPIDPRRHKNNINLFDETPYTPPKPARRDPNYSGDDGSVGATPRSGRKMVKTASNSQIDDLSCGSLEPRAASNDSFDMRRLRERPIAHANESQISLEEASLSAVGAENQAQHAAHLEHHRALAKGNESHFKLADADSGAPSQAPRTLVKHFPGQTAFSSHVPLGSDNASSSAQAVRPSSRVLNVPGGSSSIVLG